jgi:diguanylate cyclase (GGDEF)-like protein
MAFETERIRGAIRPQDSVTLVIALMGVAIAVFLDDAVIRLIGACVALLGGAALYMTVRQRQDDNVQVHTRRTTLPPPAFKTRVTTDPGSSTKRIHFDDFQETFVADEDSEIVSQRSSASSTEAPPRAEFRPAPASSIPGLGDDGDLEFSGGDDGSFRVVRAPASSGTTPENTGASTGGQNASSASMPPMDVPRGGSSGGDSSRGQASRGAATRADDSRGASRSDAASGGSSRGDSSRGDASRGDASRGAASHGDAAKGGSSRNDASSGNASRGDGAQGAAASGARADASGETSRRDSSRGDAGREGEPASRSEARLDTGGTTGATAGSTGGATSKPAPGAGASTAAVAIDAPASEAQADPEREATLGRKQVQMILDDLASDESDDASGSEPRAEFVRLVGQVLNAVARSMSARSILFCWVNLQKRHIIPEARLTTGSFEIRAGARLPIGNDVISQIAESGIPEILTDIGPSAEANLISYYTGPADTRSFVGVPVFFRREVVGVLAADSSELNAFDESAVATLAEYTRLITGLIRGYTEKYDLQLTARTLEAFERMQNAFAGAALTPTQVARILSDQTGQLFDHHYVAVVLFDDGVREWRVAASHSGQGDYHVDGLRPDMTNSLVGYVTRNAEEVYLEQVDREVLFSAEESFAQGGSFICIPLVGTTRCYGALAVAHAAASAYIPRDIDLLRDLARFAAMAIEVYNVNNAIENQSVVDEVTGAYNAEFLGSLLERESRRARDYRKPLSYSLIAIDIPASMRDAMTRELEDTIASSVGTAIGALVRPYDVVGRLDARTFGVVLVERNDQEAYLWAEKLRKDVAGRIITHGARKFSVTVSVGICDQSDLPGSETISAGAHQALERARTGEGNAVILY